MVSAALKTKPQKKRAPVESRQHEIIPQPDFIVLDLFCGAGGTTCGYVMTGSMTVVAAAINHDKIAIQSHWSNHPEVEHFEEDITCLYGRVKSGILLKSPQFQRLIRLVDLYRAFYPNAKVILWASLECINYSRAKGGQPRDADSRTLANHLDRYIIALKPHYVKIENVVEFMAWGPMRIKAKACHPDRTDLCLIKDKKSGAMKYGWEPLSKKNGQYWLAWRQHICDIGYRDEWKEINSADFGAYTSRNRLFGIFALHDLPIAWPEPTHCKLNKKKSSKTVSIQPGLFDSAASGILQPWKAVKEVLDFSDEGQSIFNRQFNMQLRRQDRHDLAEKSLMRVHSGLVKFVAGGKDAFLSKHYSVRPDGKLIPVDGPAGTLTTTCNQSLVQPVFLMKYNSVNQKTGHHTPPSINDPAPVISTQGRLGIVKTCFLAQYYGCINVSGIDAPAPTIPTNDRHSLVSTYFLDKQYGGENNHGSIEQPAGSLLSNDKHALVNARYFIARNYTGGGQLGSIEDPAGALTTVPKINLVESVPFLMPTNYSNPAKSIEDPAPVITANHKHTYLVNPSYYGIATSTEVPCPVIIAGQNKAPLYFVLVEEEKKSTATPKNSSPDTTLIPVILTRPDKEPVYLLIAESEKFAIAIYDTDSPCTVKIKEFMAFFNIVDIKIRMLKIPELKLIQGFPANYVLAGSQTDQKKFIGNSVHPYVPKFWAIALKNKLSNTKIKLYEQNYN